MLDETITVAYTCKPSTCDHESGKNRARMVARSSHGPCRNIIERGGDGMFVLCVPWCGERKDVRVSILGVGEVSTTLNTSPLSPPSSRGSEVTSRFGLFCDLRHQ